MLHSREGADERMYVCSAEKHGLFIFGLSESKKSGIGDHTLRTTLHWCYLILDKLGGLLPLNRKNPAIYVREECEGSAVR